MKKIRLQFDALRVESFATAAAGPARGTVRGNALGDLAADPAIAASDLCTDQSYVDTCIFYTCAGCTTADPDYC